MNNILSGIKKVPAVARVLGSVGVLGAATTLMAAPALASATADLSVNPTATKISSTQVVVSGTYRCTPTPQGNLGQISVYLTQPGPNGSTLANGGVVNVVCDGTERPWSDTTFGSVGVGAAHYHVVLNAVPTAENVVQDGTLTVL